MKKIVLASTSVYRQQLLSRLGIDFSCRAPNIDESPKPEESAEALVKRLAYDKAFAVAKPGEIVIGSDQLALINGQLTGKPLSLPRARSQLLAASGCEVLFLTSLCVIQDLQPVFQHIEPVRVRFRTLTEVEIDRYLQRESVLDCAGSFKAEGLGISLFEHIDSLDPNALIGLPLIALCQALRLCGLELP